jgi:hypothetical protein
MSNGNVNGTGTGTAQTTTTPTTLSGQVINAKTGMPIPRALVRLNDRAILTDHEGKFELDQLTGDGGNLQVTKPGFSTSTDLGDAGGQYVRLSQAGDSLQLRLYPEALLTGTVTGPDGYPLPHILVSAMRSVFEEEAHQWPVAGQAVTDSHGNFRLTVPAGDYRLETQYSPRNSSTSDAILPVAIPSDSSSNTSDVIRIRSGEEQHFDLHPAMGKTHTVMVTMEGGSERGFPMIVARSSHGATLRINSVRNGAGGGYGIELPSGTYTLTASMNSPDGIEQAETTVTVTDHDVSGVSFRFSPVPTIPVELVVDQAETSDNASNVAQPSLPQLGLTLENEQTEPDRGNPSIHLSPQRDRSYAFSVPPGSYRFGARNRGEWYIKSANYGASDLFQQDLVVGPGAGGMPIRVVVSNQTGSLQGTVTLNGEPAVCWVYLVPTAPSASAVISVRSNSDGGFSYPYLEPGSYQAVAFEYRHPADYRDPETLTAYSSHVRGTSVQAGDKGSLELDAVSAAELAP